MAASRVGAAASELEECGGERAGGAQRRTGVQWCEQEPMADRRMWHVGKEKDGDDMWGPHVSE